MRELVSIIIVNYNGKKWIKKCLDSILLQIYSYFEVVFVDNASTDNSIEFIENNYKDNRIKIIKSDKNLGFAGGNNLGIDNSKGKYILLLNNDTWIDNDFLEELFIFYNSHGYDVIAPTEAKYLGEKHKPSSISIDLFGHPIYFFDKSKQFFYLSGACLFFKKSLYSETYGLDNNFFMYFEEIDWFWRMNLLEKKFSQINDVFVYHFGAGSTGDGIKYLSFLWRNQNTLQMLLKNYKWFNLLWVLPIYFIQNIFEIIFFLIILKPKISYSYIESWIFNIKNIRKILEKRKWVQENRKVGDYEIMKNMYLGFGKIKHLIYFYEKK